MSENRPRGTPARVLLLFSLLLGGVAAMTWRSASGAAEGVLWPTATGQADFFDPIRQAGGIELNGMRWTVSAKEHVRRDERMFRVRRIEPDGTSGTVPGIYADREGSLTGEARLYARTAPGRYRRLRQAPAAAIP